MAAAASSTACPTQTNTAPSGQGVGSAVVHQWLARRCCWFMASLSWATSASAPAALEETDDCERGGMGG